MNAANHSFIALFLTAQTANVSQTKKTAQNIELLLRDDQNFI